MKKNKKPKNIGLEQLRAKKQETINRWDKLGLLEGLDGNLKENIAQLYESQQSHIINEDPSQIVDDK